MMAAWWQRGESGRLGVARFGSLHFASPSPPPPMSSSILRREEVQLFPLADWQPEELRFESLYGEGKVWLEINEHRVKQYDTKDNRVTNTCYVEAQRGKAFRVHYSFPSIFSKPMPVYVQLYIDGKFIDADTRGCGVIQPWVRGHFEGFKDADSESTSTFKAFSFAEPKTSKEPTDGEKEDVDEVCSIKVIVGWRKVIGKVFHEASREKAKERTNKWVSEDSKTAFLGVCTVPGGVIETDRTYKCLCKLEKINDAVDYTFIFKYRKRKWLSDSGIVFPPVALPSMLKQAALIDSITSKREVIDLTSDDSDDE